MSPDLTVWERDLREGLDDFFDDLDVEAVAVLEAELDEAERVTPFGNEDLRGETLAREDGEALGRGIVVETGILTTREG